MKRVVAASLILLGMLSGSRARGLQINVLHADGPLPSFDVATIKPFDPKNPSPFTVYLAGTKNPAHIAGNIKALISQAYQTVGPTPRVFGGPDWVDRSVYRIEAKIPDEVFVSMQKSTPEERTKQQNLMLQRLLAERCKLQLHIEKRELPIYELVVIDKATVKFPKAADNMTGGAGEMMLLGDGVRMVARNVTMQSLAQTLQAATSRIVIDKTGVEDRYDVEMKFSPDSTVFAGHGLKEMETASAAPSVFEVLKDMGLKLVPGKTNVEVVVIDHVEEPTEN